MDAVVDDLRLGDVRSIAVEQGLWGGLHHLCQATGDGHQVDDAGKIDRQRSQADRHRDDDDGFKQHARALWLGRLPDQLVGDAVSLFAPANHQVEQSRRGGQADAQHRRAAGQLRNHRLGLRLAGIALPQHRAVSLIFPLGQIQHRAAQAQSENHLGHRLDDLGDGGRVHVLHSLIVTAVGRHQAAGQHRGGKADDGKPGAGIWNHRRKGSRAQNHHHHAQKAGEQKEQARDAEDFPAVPVAPQDAVFRNQLGDCHRKSGGGDGGNEVKDLVGIGKIGVSCPSQHVADRDFKEHADHLDGHRADHQDHRSLHKALLLICLSQLSTRFLKTHLAYCYTVPHRGALFNYFAKIFSKNSQPASGKLSDTSSI